MIGKSIKPETNVWNPDFGFGIFKGWSEFIDDDAIVNFEFGTISVTRKNVTEIEDEPKEKQEFNPPV